MRWNSLRMLTAGRPARAQRRGRTSRSSTGPACTATSASCSSTRVGTDALVGERQPGDDSPYELSAAQRLFLYTRADTIYGGSNQIQRNIIGERGLGLPPEPRPPA